MIHVMRIQNAMSSSFDIIAYNDNAMPRFIKKLYSVKEALLWKDDSRFWCDKIKTIQQFPVTELSRWQYLPYIDGIAMQLHLRMSNAAEKEFGIWPVWPACDHLLISKGIVGSLWESWLQVFPEKMTCCNMRNNLAYGTSRQPFVVRSHFFGIESRLDASKPWCIINWDFKRKNYDWKIHISID